MKSRSGKMTCPDCSPPIDRLSRSSSSITYLSPTGHRTRPMPRSRSAISRPMLLITVATTALPRSRPVALHLLRAEVDHRVAVDDAARPRRRRSRGRRRRRRRCRDRSRARRPARASPSGCVDPQSRLMLRPSGLAADRGDVEAEALEHAAARRGRSRRSRSRWPACARAPGTGRPSPSSRARDTASVSSMNGTGLGRARRLLPRRVGDDGLDFGLELLGELLARAREHLDAVVLERVVRRRDDQARVEPLVPASGTRSAGVGMTPALSTLAPAPRAPRARSRSIPSPDSRVSRPDQQARRRRRRRERPDQRGAQPPDRPLIEGMRAGPPAHAVGAEQFRAHRMVIWTCTGSRRATANERRRRDAHGQRVAAGPEAGQVHRRADGVDRQGLQHVVAAADGDRHVRRRRLGAQRRRAGSACARAPPANVRSVRTGATSTNTRPWRGMRSRAALFGTPIVTVSRTETVAPSSDTGSVVACFRSRSALSGPIDLDLGRLDGDLLDGVAGRGLPLDRRHDRHASWSPSARRRAAASPGPT